MNTGDQKQPVFANPLADFPFKKWNSSPLTWISSYYTDFRCASKGHVLKRNKSDHYI